MMPAPAWLLAALNDPFRLIPRIEWSPDWSHWYPLRPLSGSHSQDRTRQNRWDFTGTFAKDYPVNEQGLHAYGPRARIFLGVKTLRNPVFWFPQGVYTITAATEDRTSVQLAGSSLELEVAQSDFIKTRRIPDSRGESYRSQAEQLIREAVPDARFYWDDRLGYGDACPTAFFATGRWDVIDGSDDAISIMGALGGEAYCDASGGFQFVPVPTLDNAPVWRVTAGGALLDQERTLDRDDVFNVVAVSSDSTDGTTSVGPIWAWDSDPTSITYAGPDPVNLPGVGAARFGVKPFAYTNPLIKTAGQAVNAARAQLANKLGLHAGLTLSARFHPGAEVGDVWETEDFDGRVTRQLLDGITYQWGDASMSAAVRSPKSTFYSPALARMLGSISVSGDSGSGDSSGGTVGTSSFTALSGKSFNGTGGGAFSTAQAYQGYYNSSTGNRKSLVFFDTTAINTALTGKTVTGAQLRFRVQYAAGSTGLTAVVGTHNSASSVTAWPAGTRVNLARVSGLRAGVWASVALPLSVAQQFQAGTMKGITFGPGPTTSKGYYGYMYLTGADAPVLTFTYSS